MSLWTMKEVTKKIGITENALRYYNAKGVISPTVQENTGRRQWLYDDEAIWKMKKLLLLKYIGVPIEQIGVAIKDDEDYWRTIMQSLEEMKKERDRLDQKIFVAKTLAVSYGVDLIQADDDMDEVTAAALNEVIREVIRNEKSITEKED